VHYSSSEQIVKVGLFFGSFNPIHIGHLALANYFAEYTNVDEVWFVISPHNPLKEKKTLLASHHRLEMVELAIQPYEKFRASDVEFKLPQPNYTAITLETLREKHPKHTFSLIMGADNIQSLHKWCNYEYILENYEIYVYPRPGFDGGDLKNHPNVKWTEAPHIEVSSSFVRQAIQDGKNIPFFMPIAAYDFLDKMNFYKK